MLGGDFSSALAAAQRGDEAGFVALFRSTQPALLRYLQTLAPGLAEDVAAETWVAVVRALERFRGDESGWRAWVFTIARTKLTDARRQAARGALPVDAESVLGEVAGEVDVPAAVEELMSTEAALALLGRLPPEQAEVILLRHVAGLDVAHTARVLGRKPGAIRVAAHRGLHRLAALLNTQREPAMTEGVTQNGATPVRE